MLIGAKQIRFRIIKTQFSKYFSTRSDIYIYIYYSPRCFMIKLNRSVYRQPMWLIERSVLFERARWKLVVRNV